MVVARLLDLRLLSLLPQSSCSLLMCLKGNNICCSTDLMLS
jgi:hypothetical protein